MTNVQLLFYFNYDPITQGFFLTEDHAFCHIYTNRHGLMWAIYILCLNLHISFISGDDFAIIQQEIVMMKDCKHKNIVAYFGSYLR